MEKITIYEQEPDFIEIPLQDDESGDNFRVRSGQREKVTEPATKVQLRHLGRLGIYPKWQATQIRSSGDDRLPSADTELRKSEAMVVMD